MHILAYWKLPKVWAPKRSHPVEKFNLATLAQNNALMKISLQPGTHYQRNYAKWAPKKAAFTI